MTRWGAGTDPIEARGGTSIGLGRKPNTDSPPMSIAFPALLGAARFGFQEQAFALQAVLALAVCLALVAYRGEGIPE